MELPPARLEDWLRDYYFAAEINICSSGVEPYSLRELRELTGVSVGQLDDLIFDDGYSCGAPVVREAIARRWGDGDAAKVMTTCGSNEALYLVLRMLLRPGDEVVVVEPGYHSLVDLAVAQGCEVKRWMLDTDDGGFAASIEDLIPLLSSRTRAIIVNFPHNPTGVTLGQDDMKVLLDRADRVGAYVVWDSAFADLVYDGPSLPEPTTLYERAISMGTMSKSYGLPGLRFGWCIAPPDLLTHCVRLRDYTTLHVSPLVELLALAAIENIDALLTPRQEQARRNRELVRQWVEEQAGEVSLTLPAGGVAGFPRLPNWESCDGLAQALLDDHRVLVVPGSCFNRPQNLRLGFGGPTDDLVEGLARLSSAIAAGLGQSL